MVSPFCKACHTDLSAAKSRGQKNSYDLLSCPGCGTVTVDPFPTVEQLTALYQDYKWATDYKAKKDSKIRRAKRRIKNLKRLAKGTRFLDIGCNYGFSVKAAMDLGLPSPAAARCLAKNILKPFPSRTTPDAAKSLISYTAAK